MMRKYYRPGVKNHYVVASFGRSLSTHLFYTSNDGNPTLPLCGSGVKYGKLKNNHPVIIVHLCDDVVCYRCISFMRHHGIEENKE